LHPRLPLRRTIRVIRHFHREQFVPGDPVRIWDFFATPQNLNALTPSSMRFEIVGDLPPRMYPGQMIAYRVGILPGISTRWLTEITHVREGEFFVDEQRLGPYKLWHHEHHFVSALDGRGIQMLDRITYDVGWGPLGTLLDALWIRRQLTSIFDYRTAKIAELFR
jgi:ligand-binding SRPBCC domain-containing protein